MKPRIRNRARLVLAIFAMDACARQHTMPALAGPLLDRHGAWTCAFRQTAHAVFVRLLLHGLEPEFDLHLLPGVEQRLTDGFASELVQDAVHEFRERLTRREIVLLGRLGRSVETSAVEEGIDDPALLRDLLLLALKLSTIVLAEVAPADVRLDVATRAVRWRHDGTASGLSAATDHAAHLRLSMPKARDIAALLLDEPVAAATTLAGLKKRIDARIAELSTRGAPLGAHLVANLKMLRLQLDEDFPASPPAG